MVDPATAAGGALIAYLGKPLLVKLLGPSFEYLGGEIKGYTEKANENLKNIISKSVKKLGKKIDEPGQVPPKVLKEILFEGAFCENELAAEYFGGVLASSRSGVSRDDRGATYIKLVSGLSTYQLRLHYVLYTTLREKFLGSGIEPGTERLQMRIYIPSDEYLIAMDFQSTEDSAVISNHSLYGLQRSDLIGFWASGSKEIIEKFLNVKKIPKRGLAFRPTGPGMELYLWGHGMGDLSIKHFLDPQFELEPISEIVIPKRVLSVDELVE